MNDGWGADSLAYSIMYLQSLSPDLLILGEEGIHINHTKCCRTKLQLKLCTCGYIPLFPLHAKMQRIFIMLSADDSQVSIMDNKTQHFSYFAL